VSAVHWDRVRTIALREFLATVRRRAFILTLLLMPVYGIFVAFMSTLPTMLAKRAPSARAIAVVDPGRALGVEPGATVPMAPDSTGKADYQARFFATFEEAKAAFDRAEVRSIVRLEPDYLSTGAMAQYRQPGGLFTTRRTGPPIGDFVRERLAGQRLEPAMVKRILDPVSDSVYVATSTGAFEAEDVGKRILGFFVPFGFGFILALSIFTAGGYLLMGLGEEKESRILESVLALVTPDELMLGKLLGLGSAALLLVTAWGSLALVTLTTQAPSFGLSPTVIVVALLYFVVGYLFFGSFMLGMGSVVGTYQEANQIAAMTSFSAMFPFFLISSIIDQPTGGLATALSLFPWTAAVTMMMRLPSGLVPWWQVVLSLLLLAGSAYLMLRFAARIFRIGLLLYGKTPNLPEILRWARTK
jgi:ABC-2 type transport system permease protein